ncbi:MAG: hypothetical protein ACRDY2_01450 [Acidimicrobiales bacterium]
MLGSTVPEVAPRETPVADPANSAARRPGRGRRTWVEPLIAATIALAVAAPLVTWGPPGVDAAAHLYQLHAARTDLWDNFWYSGSYGYATYSLAWVPLASAVGVVGLELASVVVAAGAFAWVVSRLWGAPARWAARSFALLWAAVVFSGDYPFLLGAALALCALAALTAWWPTDRPARQAARSGRAAGSGRAARPRRAARALKATCFGLLALGSLAASPLAFLALALVVAIAALARGRRWPTVGVPLAIVVVLGLAEVGLARAFPGDGTYPFWVADLAWIVGFCALGIAMTWRVPRARPLRLAFVAYGLVSIVMFLVPNPVGAMMARLRYAAIPLMILVAGLRNWRPRRACLAAVVGAASWSIPPIATFFAGAKTSVASKASYWAPAVAYLHAHLSPSYRVEALDTAGHWPAYYLAGAGLPLVRGWFRSDDFPTNDILYAPGPLTAYSYVAWLRGLGVAYVVSSDAPPDFSSAPEKALLASGHSGLAVAMRAAHVTVYAVRSPTPMVTGPALASVVSLGRTSLTVRVGAPGAYRVVVHWSPYWHASAGCVTRAPGGMTTLVAGRPGVSRISFDVDPSRVLGAIFHNPAPACPAAGG